METVVVVLMILVCFNFMLKQTYRKWGSVTLIAVVCALFVGLIWPYAIEQSKTQIADWLSNPALMLDTSVVLSIEVVLQMAFCMLAAHVMTTGRIRKRTLWSYKALRWFPGLLIFPVLFSGLVALIFSFPGVSFPRIAWSMAAGVLVLIPAVSGQRPDRGVRRHHHRQRTHGRDRKYRDRLERTGCFDSTDTGRTHCRLLHRPYQTIL